MYHQISPSEQPLQSYTTKKTAKLLDTQPAKVSAMIRSGELKAFKVGRQWRVPENAIFDLMQNAVNQ